MKNLDLLREAAALAGYTIDAATGQDVTNKARAQRRLNIVKADVISRYGGKWSPNYREGWLALAPLYNTGTADFTQASNTVSGTGTAWTSAMNGAKIKGGDNAYYKVASVLSATSLMLTQPYQGVTSLGQVYQIWRDEYRLYPEALSIGGFVDYSLPQRMTEASSPNMKESFPYSTSVGEPTIYTVLNRQGSTAVVSSGTVSGAQYGTALTGVATTWLSGATPIEPGFKLTVNGVTYTVKQVNSDTSLDVCQQFMSALSNLTYTAQGTNCLTVRFLAPTSQRIVHYWYYSKDFPFLNDYDEDWIAEAYPRVLINGMSYFDYIDKNDVARGFNSQQVYENSIKDMKVAMEEMYTGIRTLGIFVPPEARD